MKNKAQTRYNFLTGQSVIFAPKRSKRPHDKKDEKSHAACPFCSENLDKKLILNQEPSRGAWEAAAIKNIFPALDVKNKEAYGYQEIVIDSAKHYLNFAQMKIKEIENVLRLFQKRSKELAKDKKINYILCFKNQGKAAGSSLQHIHSQIFASAILPPEIVVERERVALFKAENNKCPYCLLKEEEKRSPRKIYSDKNFSAFCPFASTYPYEAWILSERHLDNITQLNKAEIKSLAKILKKIAVKLEDLNYDFNFFTHNDLINKHQHFYLKIQPRPNIWAGVELGSGLIINSVFPEEAASYYRK